MTMQPFRNIMTAQKLAILHDCPLEGEELVGDPCAVITCLAMLV